MAEFKKLAIADKKVDQIPAKELQGGTLGTIRLDLANKITLAANANSAVVTTNLENFLTDGTDNYAKVTDFKETGIVISTNTRPLEVIVADDKRTPLSVDSIDVYARLTEATGVFTLKFFTLVSGVETATEIPAGDYLFDIPVYKTHELLSFNMNAEIGLIGGVSSEGRVVQSIEGDTTVDLITVGSAIAADNTSGTLGALPFTVKPGTTVSIRISRGHTITSDQGGALTVDSSDNKTLKWDATKGWAVESGEEISYEFRTLES